MTDGKMQSCIEAYMSQPDSRESSTREKRKHSDNSPTGEYVNPRKQQIVNNESFDSYIAEFEEIITHAESGKEMTCDKEFNNQSNGIELILNSIMQSDLFKTFLNAVIEQRISTLMQPFVERIESLEREVAVLKETNENLKEGIDNLEQYSRRHSLRIVNDFPEDPREDTDAKVLFVARDLMGLKVDKCDIDRSHRVGKPTVDGTPRPVLVKFKSYQPKRDMYYARTKLKHNENHIYINEDLTKEREQMAKEARKLKKDGLIWDTWTADCKIFIKHEDGSVKCFTSNKGFRTHVTQIQKSTVKSFSDVVKTVQDEGAYEQKKVGVDRSGEGQNSWHGNQGARGQLRQPWRNRGRGSRARGYFRGYLSGR